MKHLRIFAVTFAATLALAALLAGCAGYAPTGVVPGQPESDVARTMGLPTGRYLLPGGGTRLEYARGPYGRHTYMIDLDGTGRVERVAQVLTEANFLRVAPGMGRNDLLLLLGRPGEVFGVALRPAQVWNWRYPTNDCLWFQVTVMLDGRVLDAGRGVDPHCDARSNIR